jgi:hypothetical protein
MKPMSILLLLFLTALPAHAQKFDLDALAKLKAAALVVKAESTVSCGDGSEDTCLRNDTDVATQVRKIIESTDLWEHFTQTEATRADAIIQFKVRNAKTASGSISVEVKDADTNKSLFWEYRDIVLLENDVVRMISHFLKVHEDAKARPVKKAPPH